MAAISFDEMKEEYLSDILDIYNYYVLNSTATFHTEPLTPESMKNILFHKNKRFKSYSILDGDEICGYCILAPFKTREAYDTTAEATIYLKQGFTGRGIGSSALAYLEEQAEKNGFHTLLAVICGENDSSINLFKNAGYEKCAHYKDLGIKFGRYLDIVCYQKIFR